MIPVIRENDKEKLYDETLKLQFQLKKIEHEHEMLQEKAEEYKVISNESKFRKKTRNFRPF